MPKEQSEVTTLHPGRLSILLAGLVFLFIAAHLVTYFLRITYENDWFVTLSNVFFLDREMNAPSIFSVCLFLINSVLFLFVWKARRIQGKPGMIWLILTGLFCFLAMDELFALHESLVLPVRSAFNLSGIFYFAWIVPYGIAVALLSLFVLPEIRRMDRVIRLWFIFSAVTFFTGTFGTEMIEGWYLEIMNNSRDKVYFLLMTFEESLEMLGLVMLTHALVSLLHLENGGLPNGIPGFRRRSTFTGVSVPRKGV